MFRTLGIRYLALNSFLIAMAGCAQVTTDTPATTATGHAVAKGAAAINAATSTDSLAQTSWELTHWTNPTTTAPSIPHGSEPIQLVFLAQGKEYRVTGYSGCNRYGGSYRLQDGQLTISVMGLTRMACPSPEKADFESAYLAALANIKSFTLDNGGAPRYLTFNLNDGGVLEFVRRQDPPTPR